MKALKHKEKNGIIDVKDVFERRVQRFVAVPFNIVYIAFY